MLKELKFVQGAVAKNNSVPAMQHFVIKNGTVCGYNGIIALSSPIALDLNCYPRAATLVKAISLCTDDETVALSITASGKLRIQSGAFKAFINCLEEAPAPPKPEGEIVMLAGHGLLDGLKIVSKFVGTDATRLWTNGVLMKNSSLFATNNVCLIERWLGASLPIPVNIPMAAIKEILRIGEEPESIQVAKNSVTFHYSDGRWIRSQLYSTEWPDLAKILDKQNEATPIDARIFAGLDMIESFTDNVGHVYFTDGALCTHMNESTHLKENAGAVYDIDGFNEKGLYQIAMLKLLNSVVNTIDWKSYPNPCIFYGDRLRGCIIGMRS